MSERNYKNEIENDIVRYYLDQKSNLNVDTIKISIPDHKTIALVAHDGKKAELVDWCDKNKKILRNHFLCGTGTTASKIIEKTGLAVRAFNSGPLGGDQQIGARIVEFKVNMLIFLVDPLTAQPHDTDVKALERIAQLYNIPMATNIATADFIIRSDYMNTLYMNSVKPFIDRRKRKNV